MPRDSILAARYPKLRAWDEGLSDVMYDRVAR